MILTLAKRELRALILSPLAWSLAAVMQIILAWLFLVQVEQFMQLQPNLATLTAPPGVTDLVVVPLLDSAAVILLLLTPLLSMRLLSAEYRDDTITLLLSSPLPLYRIVLGKYLGLLGVLGALLALVLLLPLSLLLGGTLDTGRLLAGTLGLALLLGSYAAVGLFFSSLTDEPVVAAGGTYGLLLFLWIINHAGEGSPLFRDIALSTHFHRLLSGLMHSADILYFILIITLSLALSVHRLEARRGG